ncbi:MAG: hypothetical protein MUF62_08195 [Chitinophagaceae bacterium]|jgi:hypothetical protein|nr:hypothetical protein [Chitinophagaceae bacterium]
MRLSILLLPVAVAVLVACHSANTGAPAAADTMEAANTRAIAVPTLSDPDTTDAIDAAAYGVQTYGDSAVAAARRGIASSFGSDLATDFQDSSMRKFRLFRFDLNDDGSEEIFVGLTGPLFCGTGGCTIMLLQADGSVITNFTVAGFPVVIDSARTNGWRNLLMLSAGSFHEMKYGKKGYPANPSVAPPLKVFPGDGLPRALNFMAEPYPQFSY